MLPRLSICENSFGVFRQVMLPQHFRQHSSPQLFSLMFPRQLPLCVCHRRVRYRAQEFQRRKNSVLLFSVNFYLNICGTCGKCDEASATIWVVCCFCQATHPKEEVELRSLHDINRSVNHTVMREQFVQ